MAASMRRVTFLPVQYHTRTVLRKLWPGTYCQRDFVQRLCSSGLGSVVTKDSKVDEDVAETLKKHHIGVSGFMNYRSHPGVIRRKKSQLPVRLLKAIQILLEKYPVENLASMKEKLLKYLHHRQPPISNKSLADKTREVEEKILAKDEQKIANLTGEELDNALERHKKKVLNKLRQNVYHWKPMQYDAFTSYVYLMGRMEYDFSVLLQCFTEISKRDADFKPTSIYHHGSKVGAGVWASDKIWKTIGEHYCVEESGHMNTIAQLLLQDGNEQAAVSSIPGTYFRQFSPSPKENKFSMVVSMSMLMEQPSEKDRLEMVEELWESTENYMVLVENGTTAGFTLIDEAREHVLSLSKQLEHVPSMVGHVFAPCPHDQQCPRLHQRKQPCLTSCAMNEFDLTKKQPTVKPKKNVRYSYVIFKKGPRIEDRGWPRVLHQINSHNHTHCHLCLPCGQFQHVILSKGKYEKHLYSCARNLDQGDRLPVSLSCEPLPSPVIHSEPSPPQLSDDENLEDVVDDKDYDNFDDQIHSK